VFLRVLHGFAAKGVQGAAYKNRKVFSADLRGAAVCENNHSLLSSIFLQHKNLKRQQREMVFSH
jgi:hypothetical protein